MGYLMDILIERIRLRSIQRTGELAGELVDAPSEDKEAILAELEFERWRSEYCDWLATDR